MRWQWPVTQNGVTMVYLVTMKRADGHIFNYEVKQENLRDWLLQCSSVLYPGETLTYRAIEAGE